MCFFFLLDSFMTFAFKYDFFVVYLHYFKCIDKKSLTEIAFPIKIDYFFN